MAIGDSIIVSAEPGGRFLEGLITDTSKPGTMVEIVPNSVPTAGGEFKWRCYTPGTTGDPRLVAILLADELQGGLATQAYTANTRCFIYCPLPGEILNILLKDVAGTGDTHQLGERLVAETGSGKFIAQSTSANIAQFQLVEAISTAVTADGLYAAMRA